MQCILVAICQLLWAGSANLSPREKPRSAIQICFIVFTVYFFFILITCFHTLLTFIRFNKSDPLLDCVWNVMAHAQKPYFVFRRNGRVHLNRRGRQFSRLLAAEVCASAVVMLDTPCFEVVWRVQHTHSIRQFPLHYPSRASPCAIPFQLDSTTAVLKCEVTWRFRPMSKRVANVRYK